MIIQKFKDFKYLKTTVISIFSIWIQFQLILNFIKTGIPIMAIIKDLIMTYMVVYILIVIIIICKEFIFGQLNKHTVIKTCIISILLSINVIGGLMIQSSKVLACLMVIFIISLILGKLIKYKKSSTTI